jgi:hypothetical protein
MIDDTTRLVIAYGLIALMLLAAVGGLAWKLHNTQQRRDERGRAKLAERYRQRDDAAAQAPRDN